MTSDQVISDQELLLYYYRDGLEADERRRIGEALAAQPQLAQRLHRLVARLDAVANVPDVPVPAAVQQRWQAALDGAVANDLRAVSAPRLRQTRWLALAATLAAVALLVVFQQSHSPTSEQLAREEVATPANGKAPASAYENGLKVHLASTERRLASLDGATPEERARLIDAIIGQNRIYALAAERAGEPQLARVLRAFTPVLEDAASGRAESSAANLAQLGFELRVMQARLGAADARPNDIL